MVKIRIINMIESGMENVYESKGSSINYILNNYLIIDRDMVTVYSKMEREYYIRKKHYDVYNLGRKYVLKDVDIIEVQSENKKSRYFMLGNGKWISERKFKENLKNLKKNN